MPRVTFGQERECAPSASAPGKLLIAGEYAVLEGAPALVAAINRRARAEMRASGEARTEPVSPLHLAIGGTLGSDTSELERLHLDTRALFLGQRKLGLGSSAAACVAGIAALSAPETGRDSLFALSREAHRRFQGGLGSGFDVAASTYGGVLAYIQDENPKPLALPQGLHLQAFAWSQSASTTGLIERWRQIRAKNALSDAAAEVCDAARASAESLIEAVMEFQSRLHRLDQSHSLGVSTPAQLRLESEAQSLAREYRARLVFKQSGAGGGDVGIALSDSEEALQAFASVAVQSSLIALDVKLDMEGVRRD